MDIANDKIQIEQFELDQTQRKGLGTVLDRFDAGDIADACDATVVEEK